MRFVSRSLAIRFIFLAIIGLAVIGSVSASAIYEQNIPASGQIHYPLSWLHTEGNLILNENGQVIRLQGAAFDGLEWAYDNIQVLYDGNWNEDLITQFKAHGGNSIRFPLTCYKHDAEYWSMVDEFVQWCKNQEVYVIIDMHFGDPDAIGAGWENDEVLIMQNPTTPLNELGLSTSGYPNISWVDWCVFYADRYINDPTVCQINIWNEPCYRQLSDIDALFAIWRNAADICIGAVQAINSNILCGVWGMYNGGTLRYWNSNPLTHPNVVYCIARYMYSDFGDDSYANEYAAGDYVSGRQEYLNTLAREDILEMASKYPVDLMEWGAHNSPYNVNLENHYLQWMTDNLDILKQHGIGQHYYGYAIFNPNDGDLLMHNDWHVLSERGVIWSDSIV